MRARIKHDPTRDQINSIRDMVDQWRSGGWEGATSVTRHLLEYWTHGERIPRIYWAQVEALETVIWLHEVAPGLHGHARSVLESLKQSNHDHNDDLCRLALKMATGTGKTLVMAMIILWQVCNSREHDSRFSSQFVVVTPGLIIRDRLEELIPNTPDNIYDKMNLVPLGLSSRLNSASVCIVNYQSFHTRDSYTWHGATGKEKRVLGARNAPHARETEVVMLKRVLDCIYLEKNIIVINDEAHHCYKPGTTKRRGENKDSQHRAAMWFNAIKLIAKSSKLLSIYDLSATPKFIESGENRLDSLFPWTVSDFPITDAIESGLVKIPRVPVSETGLDPGECRNVYENTDAKIRKKLNPDHLPDTVLDPLNSLYAKYKAKFDARKGHREIPPVFIIVADSIHNAKALYEHVAGRYAVKKSNGKIEKVWIDGKFPLFSNDPSTNSRLNTIMVHSRIDEDDNFDEMKDIIREEAARLGALTTQKSDLEVVRDVLATVGKKNRPGENIRCVVSVYMLSEGWDAKNVTHIFGFRKFGTQLICEQISGRALRREDDTSSHMWYKRPEFAEIYGVPFNYMVDSNADPSPGPPTTQVSVFPKDNSEDLIIEFPIVDQYLRRVFPNTLVTLDPNKIVEYEIDSPPREELQGIVGQTSDISPPIEHIQEAKYRLTEAIVKNWFTMEQNSPDESVRTYDTVNLFVQMLQNLETWLSSPLVHRPKDFEPSWLWTNPHKSKIPHEVMRACTMTTLGNTTPVQAIFSPYSPGSTNSIKYEVSVRRDYLYDSPKKSQHNCAPCHSKEEVKMAKILDRLDFVVAWHRIHHIKFDWHIPYFYNGKPSHYYPDFIARMLPMPFDKDSVHVVIEVKGISDPESESKADYARNVWIPAVEAANLGRWEYVYVTDLSKSIRQLTYAREHEGKD